MKKEGIGELLNPIYFKKIVESLHYFTFTISTIVYRVGTICRFMEKTKTIIVTLASSRLNFEVYKWYL